jgi:hypothetical protein
LRIDGASEGFAARGFDLLDEGRELVAIAPSDEDRAPMKPPAPITATV